MSNITQTRKFVVGDLVTDEKLDDIASTATISDIKNSDIDAGAAIVDTKLATITAVNKVNTTALTTASQVAGDILINTGSGWTRLAIGSAGQELGMEHDAYTKLLLTCDGTDGATTFSDSSQGGKTITNTANYDTYTKACSKFDGSDEAVAYTDPVRSEAWTFNGTAQLDTAQKKFGSASLLLDGDSDYVTLADSDDWDFGEGDWTIDCWFRLNAIPEYPAQTTIIDVGSCGNNYGVYLSVYGENNILCYGNGGNAFAYAPSVTAWVVNTWYHVAVVGIGGKMRIYLNGSLVGVEQTISQSLQASTYGVTVGKYQQANANYHNGWIDELRISKGIARWSANFTVPAYPYGQVAVSTAQKKFGTASGYFDGSGSRLSLADSDDWNFADGEFTIDMYIRFDTVTKDYQMLYSTQDAADDRFIIYYSATRGGITVEQDEGSPIDFSWVPTKDTWYHLAIVRTGDNLMVFVNGTQIGSTESFNVTLGDYDAALLIGCYAGTYIYGLSGYIDELRISKGVARWTSNFTAPTSANAPELGWYDAA